ncbi:telomere repeat-binding protein 5 isoform X1 [Pyrus x bretschneideri]|uniref:telomere repeat-binding protein 5 isoform X1 n=1 Tax=Pyrus x bretschneideri TaxID=225117 RepID=UPI002030A7B1|nr:telomere repeat-binding protein 5 isoform X1 [Pyrus x bretschneideri]XP_048439602.1 telomere repeat-binding protein 5 isoform X1 [Pyrus x bretschneideri]XP_048439603.1 telomere repeat-binding protein 5 isoform X1 [Pyrus x bretschneideri]
MVLQRRLEYGFNGYRVPEVPRASRSARGRGPIRSKFEANQIHAFESLAGVAGKLLQESKDPLPTNDSCGKDPHFKFDVITKSEQQDTGNLLKEEPCELGSCDEETFLYVHGLQEPRESYTLNGVSHSQENFSYEINSVSKSLDSEGINIGKGLGAVDSRIFSGSYSNKVVNDSPLSGETIVDLLKRKRATEPSQDTSIKDERIEFLGSSEDVMEVEERPHELVSSEHDVKTLFSRECKNRGPFLRHRSNIREVNRDDDEYTMTKEYEHPPDNGDRTIMNLAASGHDGKRRQVNRNWRTCYAHQRSQKIYPFKKRKLFNWSPLNTSDRGCNCEDIFNSPDKIVNGDSCCAAVGSSSTTGQQVPPKSNNLKLSIKSFKVPELFIEVPTTATVGSLKRTVMEAVTSILGDGLHVGILVQGKKVRDDNKTLLQTGISQDDKRHNLGFILEPKRAKLTYPPFSEDPSLVSGRSQELTRHSTSLVSQPGTSDVSMNPPVLSLGGRNGRDFKVPSLAGTLIGKTPPTCQALVAVPPVSMKALAVVPFHRKSGHQEYVQRRIRRPFSVPEVEALVQAVEKLGTGRWRDVKLRAFESEKHRTYVDLKDKWKTLVHTARISPQQRRGEPVPQELLDRVLATHAYWSHRHAKQQVKVAV